MDIHLDRKNSNNLNELILIYIEKIIELLIYNILFF